MLSRDEMQGIKARELAKMATQLGIKGAHDMKKAEVIEAILNVQEQEVKETEIASTDADAEVVVKEEKSTSINMEQKMAYVEQAEIGTIIAFRLSNGRVKSAKIMKRSTKNRKLKVETDYGAEYIIGYEDVVWVRTGKRWPKGVYQLLKGHSEVVVDGEAK